MIIPNHSDSFNLNKYIYCTKKEAHSLNRRVEMKIIKFE